MGIINLNKITRWGFSLISRSTYGTGSSGHTLWEPWVAAGSLAAGVSSGITTSDTQATCATESQDHRQLPTQSSTCLHSGRTEPSKPRTNSADDALLESISTTVCFITRLKILKKITTPELNTNM